jgi:hydroxymethylbilane synthase
LARKQAAIVATLVRHRHPDIDVEIKIVGTTGDRDRRPFRSIAGKGLFVAEIERSIVDGDADVAVHSAKDLTAELAPGCAIVCVPERGPVHDVVVGGRGQTGEQRIASLEAGARVGTSSMRRRALLAEARQDVEVVDLRGNLDTRLGRVAEGFVDAAVVAAAGVERLLGDQPADASPLEPNSWVPPPGQGALAVEAMSERADIAALFADLSDARAQAELACERAFAERLEGGCSVPLGCLARASAGNLVATGYLGHPDGGDALRDRVSGGEREAVALGTQLADSLLQAGGDELLAELRDEPAPEIDPP